LPCLRRLRGSQERVLAAAPRPAFLHS
jgi:hypothetical protein